MPKRIQRKRTKGWRMPEGAVYVGRPTVWGNPFKSQAFNERILETFEHYCVGHLKGVSDWLEPLRGKDLAYWCPLSSPCHADVLLRLANEPQEAGAMEEWPEDLRVRQFPATLNTQEVA
jgi:hypothetical protein